MRAFQVTFVIAALALLSAAAIAEPKAGPGYELETFTMPGAVFAGLSRDGDDLLVTDLAGGRLYRRHPDGKLTAFGPIFPHGRDVIGDPTGPYRVLGVDGAYIVAQGWAPAGAEEGPYDHALVRVDGELAEVISNDFWNPYDFIVSGDGYYVVDAARNTVERLERGGTGRRTLIRFDRIGQSGLQELSPTEFPKGSTYEVDAVPTGIALHDRRLYISLFGGFPFVAGGGKVVSALEDVPAFRVEQEGLNAPVDIAIDTKGHMFVLEHGLFDQATGFQTGSGRLLRFDAGANELRIVLEGLTRPVSVLVWDERQIIVSDLGGNLHFLTGETAN